MNHKTARFGIGLVVPLAAFAVGYVPFLALRSDLPDPLASHFTSGGVPDGSMSPTAFMLLTSILFVVGVSACLVVAVAQRPVAGLSVPGVASIGGFFCGFASGILLMTALSQRGLESWTEASFSWARTLLALALSVVAAAAAIWFASKLPSFMPESVEGPQPVMELGDTEHVVWTGQLRNSLLSATGMFMFVVAGFIWLAAGQWISVLVIVVSAVAVLATASFTVRADRTGLVVRYGFLPWPRTHIAIEDIERASVIDVRPREWGGWGYRGSLTLMKQAAAVLRAGQGIRLDLRNGKVFVVTIDDPEVAVGLLNAQVQRAALASS